MPLKTVKLDKYTSVEIPSLPNFLKIGDSCCLDVAELDDDDLMKVGEAWSNELVLHAKRRKVHLKTLKNDRT